MLGWSWSGAKCHESCSVTLPHPGIGDNTRKGLCIEIRAGRGHSLMTVIGTRDPVWEINLIYDQSNHSRRMRSKTNPKKTPGFTLSLVLLTPTGLVPQEQPAPVWVPSMGSSLHSSAEASRGLMAFFGYPLLHHGLLPRLQVGLAPSQTHPQIMFPPPGQEF